VKDSLGRRRKIVRRRLCASSVSANCGANTGNSNESSSSHARNARNFRATAPTGPVITAFAVANAIDECPECVGKPWSEEFLEAKEAIEGPDKELLPF
jgi:hypothetical protein